MKRLHWQIIRCSVIAILVIVVVGCGSQPPRTDEQTQVLSSYGRAFDDLSSELQTDEAVVDGRHNISVSGLPPEIETTSGQVMQAQVEDHVSVQSSRFDVKVVNAPIKTFLMGLVRDTPHNIIPHPDLTGEISLDLKNVTIDNVMATLANVYGYDYTKTETGYEVYLPKLRSRIFHINYLNVTRTGSSQIRVSSGQQSQTNTTKSEQKDSGKLSENVATTSVSGSEVSTTSKNTFWADINMSLIAIIGDEKGRAVVVNPHSGVVIVKAMPSELRKVEDYLLATQAIISRQVVLEAKILEIELSDGFQSGINWAAIADSNGRTATIGQVGGGSILNGTGFSRNSGNSGVLDPTAYSPVSATNVAAFGGAFSLSLKLNDFDAFIEALETQGDVHVLSSPRVSTINNQKAVIKVGSDEFFVTGVSTATTDSTNGTNQSVNVELTPFFSGVALDVTPQIDENGGVTLHIHPSVSDVKEKAKEISVSSSDGKLSVPLALNSIRESDSIVRASSGQVVVIGGLMQNVVENSNAGVPWLADLPLIGALFRHEKETYRKSELVILLRPIVITDDYQWDKMIKKSVIRTSHIFSENQ